MPNLDRDRLHSANPQQTALGAMRTIDALQDLPPEHQVTALASCFVLMCERYALAGRDALNTVTNLMNSNEGKRRPEFTAVTNYMKHELH